MRTTNTNLVSSVQEKAIRQQALDSYPFDEGRRRVCFNFLMGQAQRRMEKAVLNPATVARRRNDAVKGMWFWGFLTWACGAESRWSSLTLACMLDNGVQYAHWSHPTLMRRVPGRWIPVILLAAMAAGVYLALTLSRLQ